MSLKESDVEIIAAQSPGKSGLRGKPLVNTLQGTKPWTSPVAVRLIEGRPQAIGIGAKVGRRPPALCRVPVGRGYENSARLAIGDLKSAPPSRPSLVKSFRTSSLIHNRFLALHAPIHEVG
jgi:hypothetical protein